MSNLVCGRSQSLYVAFYFIGIGIFRCTLHGVLQLSCIMYLDVYILNLFGFEKEFWCLLGNICIYCSCFDLNVSEIKYLSDYQNCYKIK